MAQLAIREDDVRESPIRASRLQADLAARILRMLKDQGAGPGHHLVELDLCRQFSVSRTPVRGALKLLAEQGAVESRANRGFVLREPVVEAPDSEPMTPEEEEDRRLFIAIAEARNERRIPDQCSQQEIVRLLDAKLATVVRVLRQLADLGLVERKPGNGWSFALQINSCVARLESYAFRRIVEPSGMIESTFELIQDELDRMRARHLAFRRRRWRATLSMEFFQMNCEYHEMLARWSHNRYVLDVVQRQNKLRSFLNIHWVDGESRVMESIDEHLGILDALQAGDRTAAHDLMIEHLAKARDIPSPSIS